MSLLEFIEDVETREMTLTVFAAEQDDHLFEELADFFEVQNISVRRGEVDPGGPGDFVVLHQEGEAVAVSTLSDVREGLFLGGSSPRFGGLDAPGAGHTPDVIASMGNTTFTVRGDDRHLVTGIAHYIEEIAWRCGGGTIHAGFGTLSELRDEPANFDVYAKLEEAGVEVHAYGRPDVEFGDTTGFSIHPSETREIRQSRFVAFDGAGDPCDKAAMVATEVESGSFRGFWTFDGGFVDEIVAYLRRSYSPSGG